VHPGAEPHLGEQANRLRNVVRGLYPAWPSGGYHQVDVREVAKLHAAVMSPGAGPRRYIVPGHHVDGRTIFNPADGDRARLPCLIVPAQAMLPSVGWRPPYATRAPVRLPEAAISG
jgi:dihydroflavonol-4-reductase